MREIDPMFFMFIRVLLILTGFNQIAGEEQPPLVFDSEVKDGIFSLSKSFHAAAKKNGNGLENLVYSPFSLWECFALIKIGTRGETAEELIKALNFPSTDQILSAAYKNISQNLDNFTKSGESTSKILTASRIYIDSKFKSNIEPDYEKLVTDFFGGGFETLKLEPPAAPKINEWVSNATEEKIKDLVQPSDLNDAKMLLINGVYFKGTWQNEFGKWSTYSDHFYPSEKDDEALKVEMMHNRGYEKQGIALNVMYLQDLDTDVLELPYKLGVSKIFKPGGDFSRMVKNNADLDLFVGVARQKALVTVDEAGTEAAGATFASVSNESACYGCPEPPPAPWIRVDHPFYYQIVDKQLHLVLFAGTVVQPQTV